MLEELDAFTKKVEGRSKHDESPKAGAGGKPLPLLQTFRKLYEENCAIRHARNVLFYLNPYKTTSFLILGNALVVFIVHALHQNYLEGNWMK